MKENSWQLMGLICIVLLSGCRTCTTPVAPAGKQTTEACPDSLKLARRELPAEQNAYVIFTNAMPEIKLPDDKALQDAYLLACTLSTNMPEGEARKQLDAWLESKKEPLALISQGIALGQFQFPDLGINEFTRYKFSDMRHAARVKVILAREHAERGEYTKSAREFVETFKMGQLITAGEGSMIHYLVGMAVQGLGLNGMRWLVCRDDVPPEVLRQIQSDLPIPSATDPILAQTYRAEYARYSVPALKEAERNASNPTNDFPIRISRVFDLTNSVTLAGVFSARFVTNALTPWPNRDTRITSDIENLVTLEGVTNNSDFFFDLTRSQNKTRADRKKWKQLEKLGRKHPNILGKLMLAMIIPVGDKLLENSVQFRTKINLTRTLVALQLYRRDIGDWPESLEDVRLKSLLPDPPIDFFTGKSVLYSREKGMLWSVGADGKDDGGDDKKDVVITFPTQTPQPAHSPQGK